MARRLLTTLVVATQTATTAVTTMAATVTFKNQCEYSINVYDNYSTCPLKPGSRKDPTFGCDRALPGPIMYRHEVDPQATLAEFAYGSGKAWYDISIIPPGPQNCSSFDDCQKFTRKVGFNVPIMILPTVHLNEPQFRCHRIMCHYNGCPDAFHFPDDTQKVYNCPDDEHFHVIYCP